MAMFTILYLDPNRSEPLSGHVRTEHDEQWLCLTAALNELGSCGWGVETPIYGPGSRPGDQVVDAFLLVNNSLSLEQELVRRISRLERMLEGAKSETESMAEGPARRFREGLLKGSAARLEEWRVELAEVRAGKPDRTCPGV